MSRWTEAELDARFLIDRRIQDTLDARTEATQTWKRADDQVALAATADTIARDAFHRRPDFFARFSCTPEELAGVIVAFLAPRER